MTDPAVSVPPTALALPGVRLRDGFAFREGQRVFLEKWANALRRDEPRQLGVFVPGYGKTITALAAFVVARALGAADRLVVFVPRGNLRDQYADAHELATLFRNIGAPPLTFCVADSEQVFLKNLSTDIIVTTYQYASGSGGHSALLKYCQASRAMFVFDEVHHLSDDGLWAEKIRTFPHACSVGLSGTPIRSDNKTLFGVPFEEQPDGDQFYVALHEVGMRDAHAEGGILKQVKAHVVDYQLQMVRADTNEEVTISLSEMREIGENQDVDTYLARRKLRFHDVYLESLLAPAFTAFAQKRRALRRDGVAAQAARLRQHQMLVIAMSNKHAAAILAYVQQRFPQFSSARIGQDLPARDCADRLEAYRRGDIDVMVQVDMIGEGTDIKPISVIVKADLVRAYSKTLQQVFRGMRYFNGWSGDANVCDLFAANDSDVVSVLEWITSEEQIGIRKRPEREAREAPPEGQKAPERSKWELKNVESRRMSSHALDMFQAGQSQPGQMYLRPLETQVIDVSQRERLLRQECAELATELHHVLRGDGQQASIRVIHAASKKKFGRAQDALSVPQLEMKKKWLERCLRARRLL